MKPAIKIGISKTLGIRGIIATKQIKKGSTIEECPIILYSNNFDKLIAQTPMGKYDFEWDSKSDCIALGYGSIYNHSYDPNAKYIQDKKRNLMVFKAIKNISSGEEITINYNGNPEDKSVFESGYLNFDKNYIYKKISSKS